MISVPAIYERIFKSIRKQIEKKGNLEKIQKDARKSRQEGLEYIRSSEDYEYYSGKNW